MVFLYQCEGFCIRIMSFELLSLVLLLCEYAFCAPSTDTNSIITDGNFNGVQKPKEVLVKFGKSIWKLPIREGTSGLNLLPLGAFRISKTIYSENPGANDSKTPRVFENILSDPKLSDNSEVAKMENVELFRSFPNSNKKSRIVKKELRQPNEITAEKESHNFAIDQEKTHQSEEVIPRTRKKRSVEEEHILPLRTKGNIKGKWPIRTPIKKSNNGNQKSGKPMFKNSATTPNSLTYEKKKENLMTVLNNSGIAGKPSQKEEIDPESLNSEVNTSEYDSDSEKEGNPGKKAMSHSLETEETPDSHEANGPLPKLSGKFAIAADHDSSYNSLESNEQLPTQSGRSSWNIEKAGPDWKEHANSQDSSESNEQLPTQSRKSSWNYADAGDHLSSSEELEEHDSSQNSLESNEQLPTQSRRSLWNIKRAGPDWKQHEGSQDSSESHEQLPTQSRRSSSNANAGHHLGSSEEKEEHDSSPNSLESNGRSEESKEHDSSNNSFESNSRSEESNEHDSSNNSLESNSRSEESKEHDSSQNSLESNGSSKESKEHDSSPNSLESNEQLPKQSRRSSLGYLSGSGHHSSPSEETVEHIGHPYPSIDWNNADNHYYIPGGMHGYDTSHSSFGPAPDHPDGYNWDSDEDHYGHPEERIDYGHPAGYGWNNDGGHDGHSMEIIYHGSPEKSFVRYRPLSRLNLGTRYMQGVNANADSSFEVNGKPKAPRRTFWDKLGVGDLYGRSRGITSEAQIGPKDTITNKSRAKTPVGSQDRQDKGVPLGKARSSNETMSKPIASDEESEGHTIYSFKVPNKKKIISSKLLANSTKQVLITPIENQENRKGKSNTNLMDNLPSTITETTKMESNESGDKQDISKESSSDSTDSDESQEEFSFKFPKEKKNIPKKPSSDSIESDESKEEEFSFKFPKERKNISKKPSSEKKNISKIPIGKSAESADKPEGMYAFKIPGNKKTLLKKPHINATPTGDNREESSSVKIPGKKKTLSKKPNIVSSETGDQPKGRNSFKIPTKNNSVSDIPLVSSTEKYDEQTEFKPSKIPRKTKKLSINAPTTEHNEEQTKISTKTEEIKIITEPPKYSTKQGDEQKGSPFKMTKRMMNTPFTDPTKDDEDHDIYEFKVPRRYKKTSATLLTKTSKENGPKIDTWKMYTTKRNNKSRTKEPLEQTEAPLVTNPNKKKSKITVKPLEITTPQYVDTWANIFQLLPRSGNTPEVKEVSTETNPITTKNNEEMTTQPTDVETTANVVPMLPETQPEIKEVSTGSKTKRKNSKKPLEITDPLYVETTENILQIVPGTKLEVKEVTTGTKKKRKTTVKPLEITTPQYIDAWANIFQLLPRSGNTTEVKEVSTEVNPITTETNEEMTTQPTDVETTANVVPMLPGIKPEVKEVSRESKKKKKPTIKPLKITDPLYVETTENILQIAEVKEGTRGSKKKRKTTIKPQEITTPQYVDAWANIFQLLPRSGNTPEGKEVTIEAIPITTEKNEEITTKPTDKPTDSTAVPDTESPNMMTSPPETTTGKHDENSELLPSTTEENQPEKNLPKETLAPEQSTTIIIDKNEENTESFLLTSEEPKDVREKPEGRSAIKLEESDSSPTTPEDIRDKSSSSEVPQSTTKQTEEQTLPPVTTASTDLLEAQEDRVANKNTSCQCVPAKETTNGIETRRNCLISLCVSGQTKEEDQQLSPISYEVEPVMGHNHIEPLKPDLCKDKKSIAKKDRKPTDDSVLNIILNVGNIGRQPCASCKENKKVNIELNVGDIRI